MSSVRVWEYKGVASIDINITHTIARLGNEAPSLRSLAWSCRCYFGWVEP
jgi:hypothetical protein